MEALLDTLLVGALVGLLARALLPGHRQLGWVMTLLLGVIGAFLATYVGLAMGWYHQEEATGWVAAVVGAALLLALFSRSRGNG
ncbi:GlsB/YeaQ/YmgE family stress response membrane protein [Acidovorax sp. M2(2025)]|uniref:GlsB/YeaQ/YmgE family stress response membrane protein n=1 Tax=Acidovorax sp. M2(2025) TaxID=3411355 RepID=UPI003BF4D8BA